ncbi:GPO family capsid scaffolding protein [Ralstonia pseudosolanacearum]|uniref:GPO family capsid scaffolding protein n=1 Tax=Ralstonia pseudosolanacearum TaxID=1310165 RepID=UPI0022B0D493|nr:GPO family capsid scaffolding protein [Ralstonia pseudosolanacearum]
MAKSTKFFRIATEGATSDGRVIDRDDLIQMASNYNPETYTARSTWSTSAATTPPARSRLTAMWPR